MSSPCPFLKAKSKGVCRACGPYLPSMVEKENFCRTADYRACSIYDLKTAGHIRVIFHNGSLGAVETSVLDELIDEAEIRKFLRVDGWVTIGCAPIRSKSYLHGGTEKRRL